MANHGNLYGPDFTFLGIARCDLDDPQSYQGLDVVIVGAPVDSGTSHRSGAKFGPQAIRMGDYLPHDGERPHLALRVDALQELKIADAGDLMMAPGNLEDSLALLRKSYRKDFPRRCNRSSARRRSLHCICRRCWHCRSSW